MTRFMSRRRDRDFRFAPNIGTLHRAVSSWRAGAPQTRAAWIVHTGGRTYARARHPDSSGPATARTRQATTPQLRTPEHLPDGQHAIARRPLSDWVVGDSKCLPAASADSMPLAGGAKTLPGPERGTPRILVIPPARIAWARKKRL